MKNSIINKAIGTAFGRVVCSGLFVLGVQCGMAGAAHAADLAFGQTVQGALGDADDLRFESGKPVDQYRVVVEKAGQAYVVTASSPQFPVISNVFYKDAQQQYQPVQGAWVNNPKGQVQYSGVLDQPGEYLVQVFSNAEQLQQGGYSLSLTEAAVGSGCTAADAKTPIALTLGQTLNCELSGKDLQLTDAQGGVHYAKLFSGLDLGSIEVQASAFKAIVLYQGADGRWGPERPQSVAMPATVTFVVTSAEPGAVGAFTVTAKSGSGGGQGPMGFKGTR